MYWAVILKTNTLIMDHKNQMKLHILTDLPKGKTVCWHSIQLHVLWVQWLVEFEGTQNVYSQSQGVNNRFRTLDRRTCEGQAGTSNIQYWHYSTCGGGSNNKPSLLRLQSECIMHVASRLSQAFIIILIITILFLSKLCALIAHPTQNPRD